MSNKKFSKLAVLSLLGVLALTSCGSSDDEIKSKPSNYNDPIFTIDDETEKIHNNIISIIADQYHDAGIASDTLNKVLYRYAQTIYGAYNKIELADGDTGTTLKEAARIAGAINGASQEDTETLYAFIRSHKVYWNYNDKGQHIDHAGDVVKDDKTFIPCVEELNNVSDRFEEVETRIAKNMYSKISSGTYTSKHFFKEFEYVKSLYNNGEDVIHYKKVEADPTIKPLIIDYTVDEDEVFSKGILHRDFYQTNYALGEDEEADVGTGADAHQYHYIEKEIIPQIYSDLLVEQYLLDEESNAVKQSRARLINVIKIEKHGDFDLNAQGLIKQLVKEIYSRKPVGDYLSYIDEENNPYFSIFEKYEDISKGLSTVVNTRDPSFIPVTDKDDEHYWDAEQIIYRINAPRSDAFEYTEKRGIAYYKNTNFGDLVEDYDEFLSAESYDEIDTSLRNKFTSNGTVTPEEGFDQEKISLSQVETITKGWYVQKNAPSLDSNGEIKKNLFQLSVANNKLEAKDATSEILKYDNEEGLAASDRYEKVGANWEVRSEKSPEENKYICSINGAYFLKFDGSPADADYIDDIVLNDNSGNAYYVVQVIEAVKDVKLRNSDSPNSYANTREAGFLNKVIAEVTTKVAETGSYSSLSKEYWLKKMNITYHDQSVYDYFKSNYPDLFDDEDE